MGSVVEAEWGHSFGMPLEYGGVDGRVCLRLVLPFYHRSWKCPFDKGSNVHRSLTFVCYSLHLHPRHDTSRSRLEQSLPLPDASTLPATSDKTTDTRLEQSRLPFPDALPPTISKPAIDAVLEVLQGCEKAVEAEKNKDFDGDGFRIPATGKDKVMVDETGQPLAFAGTVDNALKSWCKM